MRRALGAALLRALMKNAAVAVGLIVGLMVLPNLIGWGMTVEPLDSPDPGEAAAVRVDRLIQRHHCWTGDAPKDVDIPGHAVVTRHGKTRLVDSSVGFAIWLDGAPGTLHAFCR